MKRSFLISLPLGCCASSLDYAIGRTLSECEEVAALFDNTCNSTSTPIDLSTHSGESVSCSGTMRCPDQSGESSSCTWTRKLCVTCSESAGKVMIRVQSNSLPNHCFNSPITNPVEVETDW